MISSKGMGLKNTIFYIIGLLLILQTIVGCSINSENHSGEYPILTMKYKVDFGMDADLLVDELSDHTITYRYFDYQHKSMPDEATTIPFEEILQIEEGIKVYRVCMYLKNNNSEEIELSLSDDFIEQLENNPEFRKKLGSLLNKEFRKKLDNYTLTSKDIYND